MYIILPVQFFFQLAPLNGHNTLSGGSQGGGGGGSLCGGDRASLCGSANYAAAASVPPNYYPAGYPVQYDHQNEYAHHHQQQQQGGEAVVVNQYKSVVKELVDAKL